MWIGTSTNLFLLDRNSGKYNEIHLPGGATYIYTLHQENNGLLYIGTSGSGLFTYDPVKESISAHYHTENSPLVSNSIYVILPTKDGNILMSTENGISIFSPTNRQFRNWTRGQGLMSTCFNLRLWCTTCQWEHCIRKYRWCTGIPPKHRNAPNRRFTYDIQRLPYFLPNCIS